MAIRAGGGGISLINCQAPIKLIQKTTPPDILSALPFDEGWKGLKTKTELWSHDDDEDGGRSSSLWSTSYGPVGLSVARAISLYLPSRSHLANRSICQLHGFALLRRNQLQALHRILPGNYRRSCSVLCDASAPRQQIKPSTISVYYYYAIIAFTITIILLDSIILYRRLTRECH